MLKVTEFVPMKDGIRLATDLYLPGEGCHPTLIVRTLYGRQNLPGLGDLLACRGYAVVIQDVRGSGDSQGDFGFLSQEPDDACDTAKWSLSQPWCDGRLAILGISYLSAASIAIAARFPDKVKAAIWVTLPVRKDLLCYDGGALRLHHSLPWVHSKSSPLASFNPEVSYRKLPLVESFPSTSLGQNIIKGGPGSLFWKLNDLWPFVEQIFVPGLHFGGWYDFLLDATLVPFAEMKRSGAVQRLILGPWTHNGIVGKEKTSGDISYGYWSAPAGKDVPYGKTSSTGESHDAPGASNKVPSASSMPDTSSRFAQEALKWLDRWVKNVPPAGATTLDEGSVRCFFTGHDPGWQVFSEWPPSCTVPTRLHLYRTRYGKGILLPSGEPVPELEMPPHEIVETPGDPKQDTFTYNPLNPVPTEGGAIWHFPKAGLLPGPLISHSHLRKDVLVYDSPFLRTPLRICGSVYVELYASSTAPDTDYTAKLVDVDEQGVPRIVADGIIRARYRNGLETEHFMIPGRIYHFSIWLKDCAHTFGPGHKIRLEISSSNFPKYDRNLNTDDAVFEGTKPQIAHQTIHMGRGTPSCLIIQRCVP